MPVKTPSTMTNADFREWRGRCGLSLSGAASALGMSRSMIAEYQGDQPIPQTVALACWAVEHGPQPDNDDD